MVTDLLSITVSYMMESQCWILCYLAGLLSLAQAQSSMDPMREDIKPFENHDTVIEATVEAIEKPSFYGTTKMFLRLLAFVETRDGETQSKGKGGLWGVTMDQFNQVQRSGFLRKPHLSDVRREFGINFQQSTYKDLDKPLISALFSLLYLIDQLNKHSLGLDAIPNDASSHA